MSSMQTCGAALRVSISDVSTPVEREYYILVHAQQPDQQGQAAGVEEQQHQASCARTERAARSREPRFLNSALLFGLPWLQPSALQGGELCSLWVQLMARPLLDEPPGVILDGREADQVVAEAWVDVGGRVAQQLLEGGTATVKMALEGGQGRGAEGADDAELTSASYAMMAQHSRAAAPPSGSCRTVLQLQLITAGVSHLMEANTQRRAASAAGAEGPDAASTSRSASRPDSRTASRAQSRSASRAQSHAASRAQSRQQQREPPPQQQQQVSLPPDDPGDVVLRLLVAHAEGLPQYGEKKRFWNPKHAPASLLVEAEVLLPEEYAEGSDDGEGLMAVTRVAPQQEGAGMAVWNQLLTLRLGPEPEALAAARLLLRVASSEDGGRKVVHHMQAELPLSSVLPGKHYNLALALQPDPSDRKSAGQQPPPALHITLCATGSAGTLLPDQAQLPPGLWRMLEARLAGVSRPLAVPLKQKAGGNKAEHLQMEVWAAWRLQPHGVACQPLSRKELADLAAVPVGPRLPDGQKALQRLQQAAFAAGSGPQHSAPGAVVDLLPVQAWPVDESVPAEGGLGSLWPDEHVSSALLAPQLPGTLLVLEMHQVLRKSGQMSASQVLASAPVDVAGLLASPGGSWQMLEGLSLQLGPGAVAQGPASADLELRHSVLGEEQGQQGQEQQQAQQQQLAMSQSLPPPPPPQSARRSRLLHAAEPPGQPEGIVGLPLPSGIRTLMADIASKQEALEAAQLATDDEAQRYKLAALRFDEQSSRARFLEGEVAQLQRVLEQERAAAHQLPPAPSALAGLGPEGLLAAYRQLLAMHEREQRRSAELVAHLAAAHQAKVELGQLQARHQELQEAHLVQGQKLADATPASSKVASLTAAIKHQEQVIAKLERALAAAGSAAREHPALEAEVKQLREENAFLQALRHKDELELLQQRGSTLEQQLAEREEQHRQREALLLEQAAARDKERGARESSLQQQLAQRDRERREREQQLANAALRQQQEALLREQELRAELSAREAVLREQMARLEREKVSALMQSDQAAAAAAAAHNELLDVTKRFAHEVAHLKAQLLDRGALLTVTGVEVRGMMSGAGLLDGSGGRLFMPAPAPGAAGAAGKLQPLPGMADSRGAGAGSSWAAEAKRGGSAGARMEGTKAAPLVPLQGATMRTIISADGPRGGSGQVAAMASASLQPAGSSAAYSDYSGTGSAASGGGGSARRSNDSANAALIYGSTFTGRRAVEAANVVRRRSHTQFPEPQGSVPPGQVPNDGDSRGWSPGSKI